MKKILIVIVILTIAGLCAFFLIKNGYYISLNQNVPIASSTPQIVNNNNVSPTPVVDETETLKAAIKAALIAEHGPNAENMEITVSKIEGDFAKGMASEQGGGGLWFAAKEGKEWKLVYDGNGTINCSLLTQYPDFPISLIPDCWDEGTNKLITR
jgi:hypothetical protein